MSSPAVVQQPVSVSPDVVCDVFRPSDEGLVRERQNGSIVIADGLMTDPADYAKLATFLAAEGFIVYSPDYNLHGEAPESVGAIERRAAVASRTIEFANRESDWISIFAHSLGGVVTVEALEDPAIRKIVKSIVFGQTAGFDKHGPRDLIKILKFSSEVVTQLPRLIGNSPWDSLNVRRLNRSQVKAELEELRDLPEDYMIEGIKSYKRQKIPMGFLVGPRDKLTRAELIRRAVVPIVGEENVIDIHPKAGHLAAQSHPHRVGKLILAKLDLPPLVDIDLDEVA